MRRIYSLVLMVALGACSASAGSLWESGSYTGPVCCEQHEACCLSCDDIGIASTEASCRTEFFVPNMLGDTGLVRPVYVVPFSFVYELPQHAWKASLNNPVVPTNQIGFNFSNADRVRLGDGPVGSTGFVYEPVQEYRFSYERTMANGQASVELMIPFNYTADHSYLSVNEIVAGAKRSTLFGKLGIGGKLLLLQSENAAASVGLRIEAPTTNDFRESVSSTGIDNQIWNFTPYLAGQIHNGDRLFASGFFSCRANSGKVDSTIDNAGTPDNRSIRDATYLMADVAIGCHLVEPSPCRVLTSLTSMLELHYTTTIDQESSNFTAWGNGLFQSVDYLNLTAAISTRWKQCVDVSTGVALPLRSNPSPVLPVYGDTDRTYEWALIVNANYRF